MLKMKKKDINHTKTFGFTFGCVLLFASLLIWSKEGDVFYKGGYPVDKSIWILILIVGLMFILHALFSKPKPFKGGKINSRICPKCLKTYLQGTTKTKCIECKTDLEPTKGFIERHPSAFRN